MNHNNIKPEGIFFFQAIVKIDGLFFRTRGRWTGGLMVYGIQDTALTMRARGVSTLRAARPREQGEEVGEGGTHSVHLRCILRKSRTCQAIRISFFIPRACPPFLHAVDMQPFIKTPLPPTPLVPPTLRS